MSERGKERGQLIAPRIVSILSQYGGWMTRWQIAEALGRDYGTTPLSPADVTALERLHDAGVIERIFVRERIEGHTYMHYKYRIVKKGKAQS